ncbi:MAG TPA: RidA family protein [Chthoniobacterales bacterium]
MKTVVVSPNAPAALGPYSQAIAAGPWVFCSGQVPLDPKTGELVGSDVPAQTRQVLRNLEAVLSAAGVQLAQIVKTTVFMTDLGRFAEMNAEYTRFFAEDPPARSTIQVVALPKGAQVEIEAIAVKPA